MRFEQQTSQDVTESLVREVSHVECVHHPVVEKVQFRIEKLVVRLELCTQQASFCFESSLNGRPRVGQHPAKWRHRPAVADEGFQEIDVLANTAERRVGIDQHETKVERQSKLFQ